MLAKVLSSSVIGIEAYAVEVEVDIAAGLPVFNMVGLPETAVRESKDRVKSAIKNSGYTFPDDRITVNLAPADIKKEGTGFDLPIALGLLAATRVIDQAALDGYLVLGRAVPGRARKTGHRRPFHRPGRPRRRVCGDHRSRRQRPGGGRGGGGWRSSRLKRFPWPPNFCGG